MHTINPSAGQRLVGSTDLLDPVDRVRIYAGATHLYGLGGPRPLGELLVELAERSCDAAAVLASLERYRQLTPELVSAAGATHFAPLLQAVPS